MFRIKNKWVSFFLLLVLYGLFYCLNSGIMPWEFSTILPGNIDGDTAVFLFNEHHFSEWVAGNQSYFFTDLVYAPYGSNLLYHTFCHFMSFLSYILGDSFLAINLIILLHYAFSGLGAYLLARFFKLNKIWAFVVGFIFAFIPYKFVHLGGHYNLQQTALIPFFILVFLKAFPLNVKQALFSKLRARHILYLLLLSLGSFISSYIYTTFMFMFIMGYFLYYTIYRYIPNTYWRITLLLGLLIGTTYLIPALHQLGWADQGSFWWRDDMAKFLTPNWNNNLYHKITPFLYKHYSRLELKHSDCFIGFSILLSFLFVTILYFFSKKKSSPSLAISAFMAFFFFMLTSPEILIFKTKIGFFPTSIYHFIPVINNLRIPERFIVMLGLFLPILIFMKAQLLLEHKPILAKLIPLLLILILIMEYRIGEIDVSSKDNVPQWAHTLSKEPKGNLLSLPTGLLDGGISNGNFSKRDLYFQTVHHHKLIGGYIARIKEDLRLKYYSNKVMKIILDLSEKRPITDSISTNDKNSFLEEYNVNYIVVDTSEKIFNNFINTTFTNNITRTKIIEGKKIYYLDHTTTK